jgi:hypothetical protein
VLVKRGGIIIIIIKLTITIGCIHTLCLAPYLAAGWWLGLFVTLCEPLLNTGHVSSGQFNVYCYKSDMYLSTTNVIKISKEIKYH